MFKKLTVFLTIHLIILVSAFSLYGQSKSDWSAVKSLVNQEVAIKTKNGKINYGIIKTVQNEEITLRLAGKKRMSTDEKTFQKSEIKKIWRALLFVNERNTGKGALIGAGVGAAALGIPSLAEGSDDGLAGVGLILGGIGGAAVGGVVGFLTKKKHKKRDLIYKN